MKISVYLHALTYFYFFYFFSQKLHDLTCLLDVIQIFVVAGRDVKVVEFEKFLLPMMRFYFIFF